MNTKGFAQSNKRAMYVQRSVTYYHHSSLISLKTLATNTGIHVMWYINFRTNSLDTFTTLNVSDYPSAKTNFNRLVDSGFIDVSISDFEGQIIIEHKS